MAVKDLPITVDGYDCKVYYYASDKHFVVYGNDWSRASQAHISPIEINGIIYDWHCCFELVTYPKGTNPIDWRWHDRDIYRLPNYRNGYNVTPRATDVVRDIEALVLADLRNGKYNDYIRECKIDSLKWDVQQAKVELAKKELELAALVAEVSNVTA